MTCRRLLRLTTQREGSADAPCRAAHKGVGTRLLHDDAVSGAHPVVPDRRRRACHTGVFMTKDGTMTALPEAALTLRQIIRPCVVPLLRQRLTGEPWKVMNAGGEPPPSDLLADCLASLLTMLSAPWPWWSEAAFPALAVSILDGAPLPTPQTPPKRSRGPRPAKPAAPWPMRDEVLKACRSADWPAVYRSLDRYRVLIAAQAPDAEILARRADEPGRVN